MTNHSSLTSSRTVGSPSHHSSCCSVPSTAVLLHDDHHRNSTNATAASQAAPNLRAPDLDTQFRRRKAQLRLPLFQSNWRPTVPSRSQPLPSTSARNPSPCSISNHWRRHLQFHHSSSQIAGFDSTRPVAPSLCRRRAQSNPDRRRSTQTRTPSIPTDQAGPRASYSPALLFSKSHRRSPAAAHDLKPTAGVLSVPCLAKLGFRQIQLTKRESTGCFLLSRN